MASQSTLPAGPTPPQHDPYAALRIPAYRYYIAGWIISLIGLRIQSVAVAWEMYARTGDALSLGLVGLAQAVPTMLLALPAGYLADKFDRSRLMMVSLIASMVTSLALGVLSYTHGSVEWTYILLFLDASAVMLGRPARSALLPQLVPAPIFANAVTWNTSMVQIASVAGPALGGAVIIWHTSAAYLIAAFCSLLFLLLLIRLNLQSRSERASGASLATLLAGIEFVWNKRILLTMISLDLFAVLLGGAVYLLPIFAEDILKVGPTGFGWLRAAPAIGAFCMAALLIYLPPLKRAGWSLLLNVAGFGVATIVFGLSTSFGLSFLMLFLTGAFDNVSMVIRGTMQQLLTPDHMRGRVSAVTSVFVGASNELGGLESGMMAHWFGPVFSVVSGGIGTLVVVAVSAFAAPELRALGGMNMPVAATEVVKPAPTFASAPVQSAANGD